MLLSRLLVANGSSLPAHLLHPVAHDRELHVVLVAAQQVKRQPKVLLHIAPCNEEVVD